MIRRQRNGVKWLEFEIFQDFPEVVHGIFLRHGGCSTGTFDSLNFGRYLGDPDWNVFRNIAKALELLGLPKASICNQVHGVGIANVSRIGYAGEADGMVTKDPNIGLLIKHADCQAALFYDPVNKVIANVHAGWRGNVQNIYRHAVEHLRSHYGSQSSDLRVGISPSLGPEDAQFINYRTELPESFWKYQIKPDYFDLWEISKQQLLDAGILPRHIEIAKISTYSNPDDFFSYRREKVSGRHGSFLGLKI